MMRPRFMTLLATLAVLGCDNAGENLGLPELRQGGIGVAVIFDRDGSGAVNSADTVYVGARVALFVEGGVDTFRTALTEYVEEGSGEQAPSKVDEEADETFPASDAPATSPGEEGGNGAGAPDDWHNHPAGSPDGRPSNPARRVSITCRSMSTRSPPITDTPPSSPVRLLTRSVRLRRAAPIPRCPRYARSYPEPVK